MYRTFNGHSYFAYSTHATRERAESALEDYLACDEIRESERPEVATLPIHGSKRWAVWFPC